MRNVKLYPKELIQLFHKLENEGLNSTQINKYMIIKSILEGEAKKEARRKIGLIPSTLDTQLHYYWGFNYQNMKNLFSFFERIDKEILYEVIKRNERFGDFTSEFASLYLNSDTYKELIRPEYKDVEISIIPRWLNKHLEGARIISEFARIDISTLERMIKYSKIPNAIERSIVHDLIELNEDIYEICEILDKKEAEVRDLTKRLFRKTYEKIKADL